MATALWPGQLQLESHPLLFTEEKARVTAPNQTKLWIRVLPATSFGTQFRFYGCLCCWVRLTSWHILLNCWKCEERLIMKWNVGKRASILQNTKEGRRVCPRLRDSTLLIGQHGRAGAHLNLDRGNPSCINTTAKVNKVTFVPLVWQGTSDLNSNNDDSCHLLSAYSAEPYAV